MAAARKSNDFVLGFLKERQRLMSRRLRPCPHDGITHEEYLPPNDDKEENEGRSALFTGSMKTARSH